VFIVYCGNDRIVDNRPGISVENIPGTEYGIAVFDDSKSLVLLGRILFADMDETAVSGEWRLETWGEHPLFPMLPVNRGEGFPGPEYTGCFTGRVFGGIVIISIQLPDSPDSFGFVFEYQDGDKLTGTASLLPDLAFDGRFEAMPIPKAE